MPCEAQEGLTRGARAILGRELEPSELEAFKRYLDLLQRWQRVHRLIGSTEPAWIVENLFLDSLLFLRVLPGNARAVADLGSGAGLPGIPMKIARPELRVALIESRQRRVSFLATAVRELALEGVRVVNARAEDVGETLGASFDAVVMRCAGDPEALLPQAERLIVPGGIVIGSGPPVRRPLRRGAWVEIPGVRPDRSRLFWTYTAP